MKKTTHKNLSERLVKYGALSVAITGMTEANGQIVHSGPIDLGGTDYIIDLNGDMINDFKIIFNSSVNALGFQQYGSLNGALGSIYGPYQYPFALSSSAIISSSQSSWMNGSFQIMNWNSCAFPNDLWCDGTDKFIGLKLYVDGGPGTSNDKTYYGWARVNVPLDPSGWMIKDFAYNSTPDAPITAGQTVLGINDKELNKIKVVSLNKSIGLYNLPVTAQYNIYNMTGQEVLKGSTNERDFVIEVPTLASGVYILVLGDTNTNVVFRKKVVLQ
jgi:hypothetical protein